MRLKSALRRGVAAAVIAGIVVSSGIPAYAARWDIANGDITVKAGDAEGKNKVSQGETIDKDDTNTVITGESDKNTVTIDTSKGDVDVTTDISSLREDGVEDIFFRYEDTMTHYSVDKMADAAGEDADVELKQNREDISLRLDGETRDDLSERYLEWVPVQTPEPQEWLILTHELAKKRDDRPSLDWWLEPEREETVEQKTSEELRRELDELLKQEREMGFQFAKKRDDLPSLDWWLEPARTETPRIGLEETLKQLASRFEAIAPEEDKPRLFLLETTVPDGTKYTNLLESDLRSYADLGDDWDDLPDTQGEIKLWIPEDLGQPKEISISKESL